MPQIIPIKELKNTSEISEMCHRTENLSILQKMDMEIWLS